MKKRRIVLASLLKPVNDTRMFEKIGASLAQSGRYEVHVIGYPSDQELEAPNMFFHMLPKFNRISLGRIAGRLKVLRFTIKAKPEILIVNTHELLGVAIAIRILFGAKIIYDIQENYWRNLLYTNAFPQPIRHTVAAFVRLKEWVTSPFFTQYFLAEKCYSNELRFIKNKFVVIENKCKVPQAFQRKPNKDLIELVFTGTLSESTGIFHTINLTKRLQTKEPKIRLTIIGYCAQASLLQKIKNEVSQNTFISFLGGNELISHSEIMTAIATANFGVIYYPPSPHTDNRIPTKLYEYLACQLPIILQNHLPWTSISKPFNAAITVDFDNPDIESILNQIYSSSFYSAKPEGMTWESEEKKLLDLVNSIF